MYTFFQRVALGLLVRCVREWIDWYFGGQVGPEPRCHESYWDWAYVIRFGLPKIPLLEELDIWRWWNKPQPDPPPIENVGIESLFLDVVGVALGDTHPQPSVLREIYGNTAVRLDSLKRLTVFYENTLVQLNAERVRLEQLR